MKKRAEFGSEIESRVALQSSLIKRRFDIRQHQEFIVPVNPGVNLRQVKPEETKRTTGDIKLEIGMGSVLDGDSAVDGDVRRVVKTIRFEGGGGFRTYRQN